MAPPGRSTAASTCKCLLILLSAWMLEASRVGGDSGRGRRTPPGRSVAYASTAAATTVQHPRRAYSGFSPSAHGRGPRMTGIRPAVPRPIQLPRPVQPAVAASFPRTSLGFAGVGSSLQPGHRCQRGIHGELPHHKIVYANVDCGDGRAFKRAMAVYAANDVVSQHIAGSGFWEQEATGKMARALREGAAHRGVANGTLVDIGANVGWYTLHMASCGHNVIAVEPFKQNADLIQVSICLNDLEDKVTLLRYGLGTKDIKCAMISGTTNHGDGVSVCSMETLLSYSDSSNTYKLIGSMEIRTLDSLLKEAAPKGAPVDVLKIDVEGHELQALNGAQRLLSDAQNAPPVLFSEFAPFMLRGAQSDPAAYLELLRGLGYKLCKLREGESPEQLPMPEAGLEPLLSTLLAEGAIWDIVGVKQNSARRARFLGC